MTWWNANKDLNLEFACFLPALFFQKFTKTKLKLQWNIYSDIISYSKTSFLQPNFDINTWKVSKNPVSSNLIPTRTSTTPRKKMSLKQSFAIWRCVLSHFVIIFALYRVFSHDVTAAILMSQNNETAAMLVSQTSPLGVELCSYANAFFFLIICIGAGQVIENAL